MTMLFVLFLIFSAARCADVERVTVVTSRGPVRGQRASDGDYTTFFGVPYAKVDEDNPFGMSLPYPNFDTPFDANNSNTICPQVLAMSLGTLQCLQLDIYVPNTANVNRTVPVLVWFHGDMSIFEGKSDYRSQHLVQHDIIVVTVNSRLGPYGFLCLDDPTVPGNQGLKDQVTALRWIKENIGAFGGDGNKVTIGGQKNGGGSVDLHLYSLYENLFDKAIIQSGSMYLRTMFTKPDHNAAIKLANYLGNDAKNTKDALKFLAKTSIWNIKKATVNLGLHFGACKEKTFKNNNVTHFLTRNIFELQSAQKLKDISILIGYNSKETFPYATMFKIGYDENVFNEEIDIFDLNRSELEVLSKIVEKFYMSGKCESWECVLELSDFFSDLIYNYPVEMSINNYIKQHAATVYKYLFSYIGGSEHKNITGVGASNTEELPYLFEMNKVETDEQILIRNRMTTMWANFVKYGNPTPEKTELIPVEWLPVTNATRPYLNIDVKMEMGDNVYRQRMAFWDLIWHNYWRHSVVLKKKPMKKN